MRKTLIAIALGLTALAAAACGNSGSSAGTDTGASAAPLESTDTLASPSDMLESPSESPASS